MDAEQLGEIFYFGGTKIFVNSHLVGFVGGHPSNVDYYYAERGFAAKSAREVAEQYYKNFCNTSSGRAAYRRHTGALPGMEMQR